MLAESYHLKSDLARVCLPRPAAQSQRSLAWVNSICLLFLIVAWSGARPGRLTHRTAPPIDVPVPIVIQPLAPPSPQAETPDKQETPDDKTTASRVVVVTPDSPAINFSVPTIGNLIVPNAIAAAPPAAPLQVAAATTIRRDPTVIGSTGEGGDRPQPPYPEWALKSGQQGTVILLLTVDVSGLVETVTVKETSGWPILDRSSSEFVKRHWIVPPGKGGRVFEAAITYQIKTD